MAFPFLPTNLSAHVSEQIKFGWEIWLHYIILIYTNAEGYNIYEYKRTIQYYDTQ